MSRRSRQSRRFGASKALIDMNSLIDLTFLLLVTFMVTLPAIQYGVEIMLPKAKAEQVDRNEEDKPTVISVKETEAGKCYSVYLDNEDEPIGTVKLPDPNDSKEAREEKESEEVAVLEKLEHRLKDMVEAAQVSEKEVRVHVRGDKNLDYDTMMKVVAVVHRSKVHKMGLLTEGK